jgi:hypothetical protein
VSWPSKKERPITRDEVTDLIRLLMGMDWKLDRIIEELGIENGETQDRS